MLNWLDVSLFEWFREEIFSVAIHPAGLYIAAGFADKIRLLNILIDDMRLFHEFPVRECRFEMLANYSSDTNKVSC